MRGCKVLELSGMRIVVTAGLLLLLACPTRAAVFTVTNTGDVGAGSLRDAMTQANITPGNDIIDFAISGSGPHTIRPLSPLPVLTDTAGVMIDGLSQAGSDPGGSPPSTAILMIEVNGAGAGVSHGFHIVSPYNAIQGVVVDSFEQDGIRIEGTELGTHDNYIFCNFVGTDPSGTVNRGNGYNQVGLWAGINIIVSPDANPTSAQYNIVEGNLVSCNYAEGVGICNCPPGDVSDNTVTTNYIGTDITGAVDMGNLHTGVYIGEGAHNNYVDGNLISGNDFQGVCIVGYAELGIHTDSNYVFENTIGLTSALLPLPNTMDGVSIGVYGDTSYFGGHARGNEIGPFNVIAHNGRHGVMIWEHSADYTNADGNRITVNSIYSNSGLGIDLDNDGVTTNDPADPDSGANQELNYPSITGAVVDLGQVTITGTSDIDSDPTQATVEVFLARLDTTNHGEGEQLLGTTIPDVIGNWTLVTTGAVSGDSVTATITDVYGNTSEFSAVLDVVGVAEGYDAARVRTARIFKVAPNPLHRQTIITYAMPASGNIRLAVYDAAGNLVETLADKEETPGIHSVTWSSRDLPGGIYFCLLETEGFQDARKMVIIH